MSHLDDRAIRRHLDGYSDPGVERHLRVCVSCALRAAAIGVGDVRWRRRGPLGRLQRSPDPEAEERRLQRLVDEASTDVN